KTKKGTRPGRTWPGSRVQPKSHPAGSRARASGAASRGPGAVSLISAAAPTSTAALSLDVAAHLVAINSTGVGHREVALTPRHLDAESNVVPIDAPGNGHLPAAAVHGPGQLRTVLLQFQRALTFPVASLPRHLPLATDVGLISGRRLLGCQDCRQAKQ